MKTKLKKISWCIFIIILFLVITYHVWFLCRHWCTDALDSDDLPSYMSSTKKIETESLLKISLPDSATNLHYKSVYYAPGYTIHLVYIRFDIPESEVENLAAQLECHKTAMLSLGQYDERIGHKDWWLNEVITSRDAYFWVSADGSEYIKLLWHNGSVFIMMNVSSRIYDKKTNRR